MRAMNAFKMVSMQSNDGHGAPFVALRLSASSPKAARATQSCVKRSGNGIAVHAGNGKGRGRGVV